MLIDISPILCGQTDTIHLDLTLEPDSSACPPDLQITAPVRAVGKITNQAGYMRLVLDADITAVAECSRCLESIDASFRVHLEKNVAEKEKLSDSETDDYLIAEEEQLDVETPLSEQIILEIPSKFLCCEDCRGLCPRCGKNRNRGDCGCIEKEPDPRFDILRKLLNEQK